MHAASAGPSPTPAPNGRSSSARRAATSPTWVSRCGGPTSRATPSRRCGTHARWWWPRTATRGLSRRSRTTARAAACPAMPGAMSTRCCATGFGSWAAGSRSRHRAAASSCTSTATGTSTARPRCAPASPSTARTRSPSPAVTARGWCWASSSPTSNWSRPAPLPSSRRGTPVGSAAPASMPARPTPSSRPACWMRAAACRICPSRGCRSCRSPRRSRTGSTAATSARTCVPGTAAPSAAPRRCRPIPWTTCSRRWPSGWMSRPSAWRIATGGSTSPTTTAATCSETRGWRFATSSSAPGGRPRKRPLQLLRGLQHALAHVRRVEHFGVATVLQDLGHQPAQRAVADGRQGRAVGQHRHVAPALALVAGALRREQHAGGAHLAAQLRVQVGHLLARLVALIQQLGVAHVGDLERAPAVLAAVVSLDVPAALVTPQQIRLDHARRELVARARVVADPHQALLAHALVEGGHGRLLVAALGLRRVGEGVLPERARDLVAHGLQRAVGLRSQHRRDHVQRPQERLCLQRRQARRAAEGVAVELLVDQDRAVVGGAVDGVATAAEVDPVEQVEVLLQLLLGQVEAVAHVLG